MTGSMLQLAGQSIIIEHGVILFGNLVASPTPKVSEILNGHLKSRKSQLPAVAPDTLRNESRPALISPPVSDQQ